MKLTTILKRAAGLILLLIAVVCLLSYITSLPEMLSKYRAQDAAYTLSYVITYTLISLLFAAAAGYYGLKLTRSK